LAAAFRAESDALRWLKRVLIGAAAIPRSFVGPRSPLVLSPFGKPGDGLVAEEFLSERSAWFDLLTQEGSMLKFREI